MHEPCSLLILLDGDLGKYGDTFVAFVFRALGTENGGKSLSESDPSSGTTF